ncbi:MAG: hypothetical protein HDR09_12860 [Lachnospiraceae bacterium]|nr:hypothetical protein [Lachnospiraceae bacterium]
MLNLEKMTTEKLCELFELTETVNDEDIPTVRGWLMDEIMKRNPEGFDKWLDSDNPADKELRKYVLEKEGKNHE